VPNGEYRGVIVATFTDSLVAYGTVALALFTVALAWSTRKLAKAAIADQRAQWRPVLIAGDDEVAETNDQLRISGPSGATTPGAPGVVLPGDTLELCFAVNDAFPRGLVRRFEVSYYDIGEWWHQTELTAGWGEERPDGSRPFRIAKTFVSETGRQLLPVHGSPRATTALRKRRMRPWFRAWDRLRRLKRRGR
jgi:hypothetical protein